MSSSGASSGSHGIPRTLTACIIVLLLTSACVPSSSRGTFILLPDDNGKTGAILVSDKEGERFLTEPRQAVRVAPGTPPGKPFVMSEKEVLATVGPALEALPKPPVSFLLYFKHDSTELTEESLAMVRDVVRTIRERPPVDISVVGHSDTIGDRPYNYRLSLKRAQAIAALLVAEGVDPSILEITSHGKDNPLVPTGDQVHEPRNRRVEVTVR